MNDHNHQKLEGLAFLIIGAVVIVALPGLSPVATVALVAVIVGIGTGLSARRARR
jgi:hypothetical protein